MLSERQTRDPVAWSHLHELLADAFATYAAGPAFALTCVFLRFDPAERGGTGHPPDSTRMRAILRGLERFGGDAAAPVAHRVEAAWAATLAVAGNSAPPAGDDARVDEVYDLLEELAPVARYSGLLRARMLADDWGAPGSVGPAIELWDVINAAWLYRIGRDDDFDPYALRKVSKRAAELCLRVAEREDAP
jgi:hypothetical protein